MPRSCSICRHAHREEIDRALLGDEPLRALAAKTGSSATALFRHRKGHIAAKLVNAKQVTDETDAASLWQQLQAIQRETSAILAEARQSQKHAIALQAIARRERQLEIQARLLSERSDSTKIALGISIDDEKELVRADLNLLTDEELEQYNSLLEKMATLKAQSKSIEHLPLRDETKSH